MEDSLNKFDFQATLNSVQQALYSVVCHIVFDFAMHGFIIVLVLCVCGFILKQKQHRFSRPLLNVARRIGITCVILCTPGLACLAICKTLPATGVYTGASLGFIVFWTMVTIYLCAEEMNYQWFIKGRKPDELEEATDSPAV